MGKRIIAIVLAGTLLCTSACGKETAKEPQIAIVQEYEGEGYPTATVEYGDVVRNIKLSCTYTPTEQEDLSFPVDDRVIERVEVKKGDIVAKGDLLVALDEKDLAEQVEELEYQLERLSLELAHTQEWKEFDIASTKLLFTYTAMTWKDEERLAEELAEIEEKYDLEMADIEDTIYITQKRLEQYRQELTDGRIIAGINGEVTYLKDFLEGSYSDAGERILTISNLESCYFIAEDVTYADYFKEAESLNVVYSVSGAQGYCEVEPVFTDQWDTRMYFKPVNEEIFDSGLMGSISLELERRNDVLCIPSGAVHESEEGLFVYVSEDGLLQMRTVTVGLCGSDMTEITGGLEQGEIIVLKK